MSTTSTARIRLPRRRAARRTKPRLRRRRRQSGPPLFLPARWPRPSSSTRPAKPPSCSRACVRSARFTRTCREEVACDHRRQQRPNGSPLETDIDGGPVLYPSCPANAGRRRHAAHSQPRERKRRLYDTSAHNKCVASIHAHTCSLSLPPLLPPWPSW